MSKLPILAMWLAKMLWNCITVRPYYSAAEGGSGLQKAGEVLGGFCKDEGIAAGRNGKRLRFLCR